MVNLPHGVELYDDSRAIPQNVIILVTGRAKSGKSFMASHVRRPLYYVMLDSHDNLKAAFAHAEEAGFEGPIYILRVPVVRYSALTRERAQEILDDIDKFATWAKNQAAVARLSGTPTGTFVIDGGQKLKGYVEKALLGESTTLGWRPGAGSSTNISTFDYAASNNALMDFFAGFANTPLDVVVTWEGRRKYIGRERTDIFESKIPDALEYGLNATVETIMDLENVIVNNQVVGKVAKPKIRIHYNGFNHNLIGRVVNGQTLDQLKELFGLPAEDTASIESHLEPIDHKPDEVSGPEGNILDGTD